MKILVIPDVHGRIFWKKAVTDINKYDKIVFLGDYLDPYNFDNILWKNAIENFKEIIEFAKTNSDKVVLLLGNHDMPYYSTEYYKLSHYHCRHSSTYHDEIHNIFNKNRDMFKIAISYDDILFTHAGCTTSWLSDIFTCDYEITSIDDLVFSLNNLLNTDLGIKYLNMVSYHRGGDDMCGSCIWADVNETMEEQKYDINDFIMSGKNDVNKIKQIYGHTIQAFYTVNNNVAYGDIIELNNNKMLDNAKCHELDTGTFTINTL